MKGSVHFRKDRGVWFVAWYHDRRHYRLYRYKGELMYHKKIALKLLALMQGDQENGTFRIEKYTGYGWTDTVPYLWEWLDAIGETLSPATYKDYANSIKNHIEPFFRANPFQLHEIQYDVLLKLLNAIQRTGKGRLNVIYCLHACLEYAFKSRRIDTMPSFPERRHYRVQKPVIKWLPEDRQIAIIEAIPELHQPIFWWLKYHLRRPAEAMALQWRDYNREMNSFIVRRSVSNRQVVPRTKTGSQHIIPCHRDFVPYIKQHAFNDRAFFFTHSRSRCPGKRYSHEVLSRHWKNACATVGESIGLYAGLKHSSCCQYVNQKGLSLSDLQSITGHKTMDAVKRYAKMEIERKRQLMERGNIISLPKRSRN